MKFTTHFGLHSQTTRLVEDATYGVRRFATYGILTLCDTLFQGISPGATAGDSFYRLQFGGERLPSDFKHELFPLHSPLLGESLLVSFPPLNDMLKFSGWSYFISDAEKI